MPGKIFIDPKVGVNYESQLRKQLEDGFRAAAYKPKPGFDEVEEDYVKYKENTNVVPQA